MIHQMSQAEELRHAPIKALYLLVLSGAGIAGTVGIESDF